MEITKTQQHYLTAIQGMTKDQLCREISAPNVLRISDSQHGASNVEIAYAPFDFINVDARIAIVGITPGRQQMGNALQEYHRVAARTGDCTSALEAAKAFASFSGPMRKNLIAMLDAIGVSALLGLASAETLWSEDQHLAHFTSALRYPVFVGGKNYSGSPSMLSVPLLRQQLEATLVEEMRKLPHAIFVPLGPKVTEALKYAAPLAGVPVSQILSGLPHPSGANAERISYFLKRKPRHELSSKTNPEKLDKSRSDLDAQIEALRCKA